MDKMEDVTKSIESISDHSIIYTEKSDKDDRILYQVPRDRGFAWLVLIAAFGGNLIMAGTSLSTGVFMMEWYDMFDDARSIISMVPVPLGITRAISGLFAGGLINKYGCRKVHFLGGLLCCLSFIIMFFAPGLKTLFMASALQGIGLAFTIAPPVVIIYEYFDKYKFFASGISMVGYSLSAFVMIGIFRLSVDSFGWRGASLIGAGLSLNQCVFAMIFISNLKSKVEKNSIWKTFNLSIIKNKSLWLFSISSAMQHAQCDMTYILSPARAVSKGMSKLQGTALITCIGLASSCCRVLASWISNLKCTNHFIMFAFFTFLLSMANIVSCFLTFAFGPLAASAVIGGMGVGGSLTVLPACLVDLLGAEMLASSFGFHAAVSGIIRPFPIPIGGLIYDLTKDFNMSFVFVGAFGGVSTLLTLIVAFCEYRKQHRSDRKMDKTDMAAGKESDHDNCD